MNLELPNTDPDFEPEDGCVECGIILRKAARMDICGDALCQECAEERILEEDEPLGAKSLRWTPPARGSRYQ